MDEDNQEIYSDLIGFDESEIDLAELKQGPPYSCKFLAPVTKFPKRTYTFYVMKCDEIFDFLVKYGQMIFPTDTKTSPLVEWKNEAFASITMF